jgi:Flp pilus assembly protein TadG
MAQALIRANAKSERGAELVEFAFALPLLLLVFAGIIDFGLLFQRYEVVTNAAREGARISTLPNYQLADVQARVAQYLNQGIGAGASASAVTSMANTSVAVATGPAVQARQVTVQYTDSYVILGPISSLFSNGGGFGSITLTAQSTMRLEVPGP